MSDALSVSIREAVPPAAGFSVWFLGQNSFVLKGPDGFLVAVDPYLSDWCATRGKTAERTPRSRLYDPPLAPEELDVDLVLLTHSHCDHADPETLSALAKNERIRVAGPRDAVHVALAAGFSADRVRTLHAGEEVRIPKSTGILALAESIRTGGALPKTGVSVKASFALPTDGSDLNHVGFLISFPNGCTFWDTGDTGWCDSLPVLAASVLRSALGDAGPDVMAVCINSGYGNLSHWDASRLAGAARPRFAVPAHWDLFPHNSCDPAPFKTSLERNAPGAVYARMERAARYDYVDGSFSA
jgi:L-ascorbate 6-phosphate lactonase